MNILFLADNFPPEKNAQATRVYERARYWIEWGHQVTVLTCAPNFPEGKVYPGYQNRWRHIDTISGIHVVRCKTFIAANAGKGRRIVDFLSFMVTGFLNGLREPTPDVVVATSPQFFAAVAGWALSRVKRRPFVFELSDLWPDSIVAVGAMKPSLAVRLIEKVELFLYRQAACIVALTSAFKKNLVRRGIPAAKIGVVPNGVELRTYSPRPRDQELAAEWGIAPEHFVLAYIGTLGMAHGLANVLAAAETLRGQPIRFLLVGPGAEREQLVEEAARRGLENVIFVPGQPKEMMPAFWSLADVALVHLKDHPVFKTVIPSKMFEAMGMGLPILLASPEGEASGILLNEGAGLLIPSNHPGQLAEAAQRLYTDRKFRADLAAASLDAAPRHTREEQARNMLSMLLAVTGGTVSLPDPVGTASAAQGHTPPPTRTSHPAA